MRMRLALFLLVIKLALVATAVAQPVVPDSKTRALLEKKGVVLVKEFSAPITLDMKSGTAVEITAYAFQVDGDAASKTKGLRFRIKYDPKGQFEMVAYLDLDEAIRFSEALGSFSALSQKWLDAKRKGNAEAEFAAVDGLRVGFFVDSNGDHQGYFSMEAQRVMFAMSPTLITAVKTHIDKVITDLKKV